MLLTSNAVDVDEGDYIDDGRHILPLFSLFLALGQSLSIHLFSPASSGMQVKQ